MKRFESFAFNASAKFIMVMISFFSSVFLMAQDKKVDIDINTNEGGGGAWYNNWWVWVIGLALFVIILVAIISAGKRK
jgi:hypothetical protein